jgi:hypothetical protein
MYSILKVVADGDPMVDGYRLVCTAHTREVALRRAKELQTDATLKDGGWAAQFYIARVEEV